MNQEWGQSNGLHAHETQIANETGPLEHKLPFGNSPPLSKSLKGVAVVSVEIHHRANVVGLAKKTGLEIGGRIGISPAAVDIDDSGAEEVLGVDIGHGCCKTGLDCW